MKMLKTKHFRRIVVFLAMLAPVVYLFGVSFAGLSGAHGNSPFDSDTEILVDNREVDFNQLLYRNDFSRDSGGIVIDYHGGYFEFVTSNASSTAFYTLGSADVLAGHTYVFSTSATGDAMGDNLWQFYLFGDGISTSYLIDDYYLFVPSINGSVTARFAFYSGNLSGAGSLNLFDITQMYGAGATVNDLISDYSLSNAFNYTLSDIDYFPVYAVPDGSQYWFSQFFARDNFLERIGKDVLSDSPHGFVPFASFWKFLDNNMLHMGDMQLGLMGYGYVYYCCHVLLFDIAFILVTFFLDFIQKVNDKIVGGVD